ncbi:calmodulin [Cystoisospora suis]|uniref:Calmodulin n=1 Tax=Cystoisospora suis TaxID=483139 RepID=A0A2C6LBX2_9APIC|nr:calmodulin [Cystoisospora suis]
MVFDRDGDGWLTLQEAASAIRSCGVVVSEKEVQNLPSQVDWQAFYDWMQARLVTYDPGQELTKLFSMFDRSRDGTVSSQELVQVIKSLSTSLSEDQIKEIVKDADPDQTGSIRYADFVHRLLE